MKTVAEFKSSHPETCPLWPWWRDTYLLCVMPSATSPLGALAINL